MLTAQELNEFLDKVFAPSKCKHDYKLRNIKAKAYRDWDRYECTKCHNVVHTRETSYKKLKEFFNADKKRSN